MADLQRTIEIIFNAIDNTPAGLSSIGTNLQSAADNISKITDPLSDVALRAEQASLAIGALGAAFLAAAVNEASEFGKKITEIGTLVNATPDQVNKLSGSVQDFSLNSTSSFDAITKAVYTATSNFGNLDVAMSVLNVAEKGAVVGATDLDTAMGAVSRTMNAYGLASTDAATSQTNAERVMAALFVTVQQGDTTLEKLSSNIGKVASTASAANIPIETVGAAIAALTGTGISTDESMTKLSALIRELINPSTKLQEALGGLSVTTDGLPAVLDRLQQATGGSADKLFNLFSSTEAAQASIVLVNDSAGKFEATLKAMENSTTTFNKNVDSMSASLQFAEQRFENAGKVLLQKLGEPLQEGSAKLVNSLSNIFKGLVISLDSGSFDPVFEALTDFDNQASDFLNQVAKSLPEALSNIDFSGVLASFDDLGGSFGKLFKGIDLTTPEGLKTAIQGVINAIEKLTSFVSGIVGSWEPAVKLFKELANGADGLSVQTLKSSGALAGYSQQFEAIKGIIGNVTHAIEALSTGLEVVAGARIATAIPAWTASLSAWVSSVGTANVALAILAPALGNAAESLIKGEKSFSGKIVDWGISLVSSSKTLEEFVWNLNLFGEKSKESELAAAGLAASVEWLKNKTGDSSINIENFNQKLESYKVSIEEARNSGTRWADSTSELINNVITLRKATGDTSITTDNYTEKLNKWSDSQLGVTKGLYEGKLNVASLDAYLQSFIKTTTISVDELDKLKNSLGLNKEGLFEVKEGAERLVGSFADGNESIEKLTLSLEKNNEGVGALIGSYKTLEEAASGKNHLESDFGIKSYIRETVDGMYELISASKIYTSTVEQLSNSYSSHDAAINALLNSAEKGKNAFIR